MTPASVAGDRRILRVLRSVLVMMVMGMISMGLRNLHLTLQLSHNQAQLIGHFGGISTTGAIANALDLHQRERPKMPGERRNNGSPCGCGHFFTDNAGIGGKAFE